MFENFYKVRNKKGLYVNLHTYACLIKSGHKCDRHTEPQDHRTTDKPIYIVRRRTKNNKTASMPFISLKIFPKRSFMAFFVHFQQF